MALTIFRVDLSSYHATDYVERESSRLMQIPGLTYTQKTPQSQGPIILITTSNTEVGKIPQSLLDRTVLLLHPNSGYDNFSKTWVEKQNFPMIVGNSIRSEAVAQYQLSCLTHRYQNPPFSTHWVKARNWERPLWKNLQGLVFGFGHIGERISQILTLLGAQLTIIDPYTNKFHPHLQKIANPQNMQNADFILMCCNLNAQNEKMISDDFFQKMKPNATLINSARGKLIDEKALIAHAKKNPAFTAYLDVFEVEPFTENYPINIHSTSHLAGVSQNIDHDVREFNYQTIFDFQHLEREHFLKKYQYQLMRSKFSEGQ
jgi:D-3-phosphoglycerate dehydrogenase